MFLLRAFYTLVMYLLTPVILYRLAWRGIGYRDYWGRWRERFGFFADPKLSDTIWIHAVSVGEMNAAAPLIEGVRGGDLVTSAAPTTDVTATTAATMIRPTAAASQRRLRRSETNTGESVSGPSVVLLMRAL